MKRTVHLSVDVRGLLLRPDAELDGALVAPDGRRMPAREAREALLDQLLAGVERLPLGEPCEGFDPKTGCPGHDVKEGGEG